MLKPIDKFLNSITMYRLVLYYTMALFLIAVLFAVFGILPYNPINMIYTMLLLLIAGWITNELFSWAFHAPTNVESVYITVFILALIINPMKTFSLGYIAFIGWVAVISQASKYIIAIGKKHIFNPAALAVAVTAVAINRSASWWIATASMMPFVLIGGVLMVRKLRRWHMVLTFFTVATVTVLSFTVVRGFAIAPAFSKLFIDAPILFFGFVMFTEPLTAPHTKQWRLWYAVLVGFLFAPQIHIASIYSTPELALLVGNIFSYIVSPKEKLLLKLKEVKRLTNDTFDFIFTSDKKLAFAPGQYLEWTLPHDKSDARGNRRYFTISSSPTEKDIRMGVKFYESSSTYKKALKNLKPGEVVAASQLAGDFTLPKDKNKKLVLVAGGVGITPFASMIKYLIDTKEKRDIIVLYSNRRLEDIAYKQLFDEAQNKLGIKVLYTLTRPEQAPQNWYGLTGYITPETIYKYIPDFQERTFYVSGPEAFVNSLDDTLKAAGIPRSHIKKDFFPGF